ncbi:TRAP transporter small permease [Pararhodobacter zhoushanensis]|uniref:TRAP transporter small permease n=1 Tax=Pararhodobacter zhoushanensis TaxID=2479545 RepID=UPI000F8EE92E|nr:TRAP transporter small permease [Pararhodobacter zhoushanensis]
MKRSWRWVEIFLELVISLCLVAMTALTVIDVAGRYFFGMPLQGAFEISELLMGLTVFASLPLATRSESHLTIGLFTDHLYGRTRQIHRITIQIISFLALAFIGWRMGIQTSIFYHSQIATGSLRLALWPVAAVMSALGWLSALVALVLVIRAIAGRDLDAKPARGTLE